MPGLGSLSTMAILLPMTFGMDPVAAVIMLAGIHYGSAMVDRRLPSWSISRAKVLR